MTHEMCSTTRTKSQIRKDVIMQTFLVVALEKIKGPTHMVEGGTTKVRDFQPPAIPQKGGFLLSLPTTHQ